jgi:hypothetical protein
VPRRDVIRLNLRGLVEVGLLTERRQSVLRPLEIE